MIRNLSKKPKRIKIDQPKLENFKCVYNYEAAKAAGIAFKIMVTFETNEVKDYQDSFKVIF